MSNIFSRKIVEMFTINHILHEFRFFVNVFLGKIVKSVKFARKIAKMFKTGSILANFTFFVNVFSEKSKKNANYREKLPKTSKTEFILANVAFFVKVISGKKRCCYRSAGACPPRSLKQNEKRPQPKMPRTFAVKTEAWRGTGPRPTVGGGVF